MAGRSPAIRYVLATTLLLESATCLHTPAPNSRPEPLRKRTLTSSSSEQPAFSQFSARDVLGVDFAEQTQVHMANLLEWEHKRAAKYERSGTHPYWADPRIHNFGNLGWRGLLHALIVPIATHMIDRFAYSGVNARQQIHESEFPHEAEVVDLCCGVGFSSARNGRVTAVDTSELMLTVAKLRRPDVQHFEVGNAEQWGETDSCNIATVMFGMHEMPGDARRRVLRNALRIARDKVLVVDIWPGFTPSPMMLSGEPFILDYLKNIEGDVDSAAAEYEWEVTRIDVVDEHVRMWRFERLDWGI